MLRRGLRDARGRRRCVLRGLHDARGRRRCVLRGRLHDARGWRRLCVLRGRWHRGPGCGRGAGWRRGHARRLRRYGLARLHSRRNGGRVRGNGRHRNRRGPLHHGAHWVRRQLGVGLQLFEGRHALATVERHVLLQQIRGAAGGRVERRLLGIAAHPQMRRREREVIKKTYTVLPVRLVSLNPTRRRDASARRARRARPSPSAAPTGPSSRRWRPWPSARRPLRA